MSKATAAILARYDAQFEARKQEILKTPDSLEIKGTTYYVSSDGNDDNDGRSPDRPWCSLTRVTNTHLLPGDAVLFRRGDLFRGEILAQNGITYGAYGQGEKPKFYSCNFSLANPDLWEEVDPAHHIWKCTEKILDVGTIVFNDGEAHSRKLIPSYINMQFVCRDDESRPFVMADEMTQDLDLYWHFDTYLTTAPTRGQNFPIPFLFSKSFGELYLRCDRGNPGKVFHSAEALEKKHLFLVYGRHKNVRIDNLCIKYVGMHGIAAGNNVGLQVTNCEIGWIGGCIQHYHGTDPNYPEGGRGTVTRFGNAIEVYGSCDDYLAANNYIYEVYDAGITHQVTTDKKLMLKDVRYIDNLIEKCVYGIEYFLDQIEGERESCMQNIYMAGNFIRLSGYGWGQQRHNVHTPAAIKGWSYTNTAENFVIQNNVFDRCAYRLLHLVALKPEFCAKMQGNTYIQHLGGRLGQYGANEVAEPENMVYDESAEEKIATVFGDTSATVYAIKNS